MQSGTAETLRLLPSQVTICRTLGLPPSHPACAAHVSQVLGLSEGLLLRPTKGPPSAQNGLDPKKGE